MNSQSENFENPESSEIQYKNWLEYDYNPFFIFNQSGAPIYLNRSAELLSGYEPIKTFNNLALSYAPIDFGYKTTFLPLTFAQFHFFAVTAGYENESAIGIRLYQSPLLKENSVEKIKDSGKTNIYLLFDISTALAKTRLIKTRFRNEFDLEIPDFRLPQNDFTKIIRKIFDSFDLKCELITSIMKLKIGEFLYIVGEKYPLIELKIFGELRSAEYNGAIEMLSSEANISVSFEENSVTLEIPLVTE